MGAHIMYIHHMKQPSVATPFIPPQSIVEVCLCHHTRRTARGVTRWFDQALQPIGLKANQFNILTVIAAHDGASTAEISRTLAMDPTTMSRNLKPLHASGYVIVERGAGRRPGAVMLSAAGRAVFTEAATLWRGAQSELTARLGTGQAGQLLQALEATARAVS
jgi:DNA-binding MarR family transcriptional regulator